MEHGIRETTCSHVGVEDKIFLLLGIYLRIYHSGIKNICLADRKLIQKITGPKTLQNRNFKTTQNKNDKSNILVPWSRQQTQKAEFKAEFFGLAAASSSYWSHFSINRHTSDLCNGIIRVVGCLHALVPADSHTHMGRLDHPNVIGTIPNGESDGFYPLLNHIHYLRLLQRRHSVKEEMKNFVCVGIAGGNSCNLYLAALGGTVPG